MVACPFINIAQPKSSECVHRDTFVQRLWLGPRPRDSVTFRISFYANYCRQAQSRNNHYDRRTVFFFDKRYLGSTWGRSFSAGTRGPPHSGALGTGLFAPGWCRLTWPHCTNFVCARQRARIPSARRKPCSASGKQRIACWDQAYERLAGIRQCSACRRCTPRQLLVWGHPCR